MTDGEIGHNVAGNFSDGGGIANGSDSFDAGTVTLTRVVVIANQAPTGTGGGIFKSWDADYQRWYWPQPEHQQRAARGRYWQWDGSYMPARRLQRPPTTRRAQTQRQYLGV